MSQSYVKECTFCKEKIQMSDKLDGKWLPYSLDGKVHECKKNGKAIENKTVPKQNNDISVEVLLKRLKQCGITLDLQLLRNVK
jgi:hypothetical protein